MATLTNNEHMEGIDKGATTETTGRKKYNRPTLTIFGEAKELTKGNAPSPYPDSENTTQKVSL